MSAEIVLVGPENVDEYGIGCVLSRAHPGFKAKRRWLDQRFAEGLRFYLAVSTEKKPLGLIEFVPAENAWRPIRAPGWIFIHCLWVFPTGQKVGGLGSKLVKAVMESAEAAGAVGVATLASDGPWMAGPSFFKHLGFERADASGRYELLVKGLRDGPLPALKAPEAEIRHDGLCLTYADQCPMLSKCAIDLRIEAEKLGVDLAVVKLESPQEAQEAPSFYGVFSLLYRGEVVADHYISPTRFRNIVTKELRLV